MIVWEEGTVAMDEVVGGANGDTMVDIVSTGNTADAIVNL